MRRRPGKVGRAFWFPLALVCVVFAAMATAYAITSDGGVAVLLNRLKASPVVRTLAHRGAASPEDSARPPSGPAAGTAGAASVAGAHPTPPAKANAVTLYFPDSNAEYLVPEERRIGSDPATPERAVTELFRGPTQQGLERAMPKGSHLRSVSVSGDVATVDLAGDVRAAGGGSTAETMVVYSVVETVTAFKGIEAVRFTVEGEAIDTLYGQMDLSIAIEPDNSLLKAPS